MEGLMKDLILLRNLYWQQKARIKINSWINVCREVRQGCVLSPMLFNVISEAIFGSELEETSNEVNINGLNLNSIRL